MIEQETAELLKLLRRQNEVFDSIVQQLANWETWQRENLQWPRQVQVVNQEKYR